MKGFSNSHLPFFSLFMKYGEDFLFYGKIQFIIDYIKDLLIRIKLLKIMGLYMILQMIENLHYIIQFIHLIYMILMILNNHFMKCFGEIVGLVV